MLIEWNDRYRIGHEEVDQQHQYIFKLRNSLESKITTGADRQDSLETIGALVDYALRHFADEEFLMQQIDFSGLARHRWRHSEFAGKVAEMATDWGSGKEISAEEIRDYLTEWLLDHILAEDMQIGEAILSAQSNSV